MSRLPGWKRLFRLPFRTSRLVERDVDDELSAHLERCAQDLIDQGADPEDARRQAVAGFGDLDFTRSYCNRMSRRTERRTRRRAVMSEISRDFGFGWRLLRRSPGFAIVTVLALALGIGANTTLFSILNGLSRPPEGITDPDRLRALDHEVPAWDLDDPAIGARFSWEEFSDYRDHNRVLSGLMAYKSKVLDVGVGGDTHRARGALASSNYFAVLGTPIALGRAFTVDEEREPGVHQVAVISHSLWQRRFGAASDILGAPLRLNGRRFVVVGVAVEGFRGHEAWETHDLWVPLLAFEGANSETPPRLGGLRLVGRIEPGISLSLAREEIGTLASRLGRVNPDEDGRRELTLAAYHPGSTANPDDGPFMAVLFCAVGLLLLVVWANLSSLFLARIAGRRPEVAVRLALGAGRVRVVRQLLAESILLALLGGAAGLALALWWDDRLFAWAIGVEEFARLGLSIDGTVIAFALGLSLVSGTVVALASARRLSRLDAVAAMKGHGGATTRSSPLRGVLVVSQLSLSLALLTCAGLVVGIELAAEDPMSVVEPDEILLASIQPSNQGYTRAEARAFYRRLQERLEAIAGVSSASLARGASGHDDSFFQERVVGGDGGGAADDSWIDTDYNIVAPRFFATLGPGLVAGRDFTPEDRDGAALVVIVNETLARRLWPGEDPIGKRIAFEQTWTPPVVREVVGLAKDRPLRSGPLPFLYFPMFQGHPWPDDEVTLVIRAAGGPMGFLPAVRREVQALDPSLPVFEPRRLRPSYFDDSFAGGWRLAVAVVGIAGALALMLAAVALYGVISYGVSERTREIGIHMALGAKRRDIVRRVLRQGVRMALVGTGIGFLLTLAMARALSSLASELGEVSSISPGIFGAISAFLVGVVLVASYFPARRAAQVDPMEALRAE